MSRLVIRKFIGAALCALPFAASHAGLVTGSNTIEGVFDGSAGTRLVHFDGTDLGGAVNALLGISVTLDFIKCAGTSGALGAPLAASCASTGDAHPGEIAFRLTSPGGTQLDLISTATYDSSQPNAGRVSVTFSDDPGVDFVGTGGLVDGTFAPVGGFLSSFIGDGVVGDWLLEISDAALLDPLGFAGVTLDIQVSDRRALPEPAGALLLATALFAQLGFRRRADGARARVFRGAHSLHAAGNSRTTPALACPSGPQQSVSGMTAL